MGVMNEKTDSTKGGDNMATTRTRSTRRREAQATKAKVEAAIAEKPDTKAAKVEETKTETPQGTRPEDLAKELGITGKQLRGWLRQTFPRPAEQKRSSWYLTEQQVEAARTRYTKSEDEDSEE
jgi:phage antirepressor YoqD-like protein